MEAGHGLGALGRTCGACLLDGASDSPLVLGCELREPAALNTACSGCEHGKQLRVLSPCGPGVQVQRALSAASLRSSRNRERCGCYLVVNADAQVVHHVLPPPTLAFAGPPVGARQLAVILGQQQLLELRRIELHNAYRRSRS